jgi:predicted transcriptional regulator
MKRTHPKKHYTVDEIATALKLSIHRTWDALEKLETKGRVTRRTVDEAIGGALWTLDELER